MIINSKNEILSSGKKRVFETGSHRDMAIGKGRCDLLPLDVLDFIFDNDFLKNKHVEQNNINDYLLSAFKGVYLFHESKDFNLLKYVIINLISAVGMDENEVNTYNEKIALGLIGVSKHYEAGALKYGANNWKLGQPCSVLLDSGTRHLFKAIAQITDEYHIRAAAWNFINLLWMNKHLPEMNDLWVIKND